MLYFEPPRMRRPLDCFSVKAGANLSSNTPCATWPNRLAYRPTASPANCQLRDEIPSIEDLQGVVEKLRGDLKERKDKSGTYLSEPENE